MNIPFDQVIWDADQCAEFLGVTKTHFLNSIRYADGFPDPLPAMTYRVSGKERKMSARWMAYEVTAWRRGEFSQDSPKAEAHAG